MKSRAMKWIRNTLIVILAVALIGFIGYKGVYAKVHNQSNTAQDTEIGADIQQMTMASIVQDMYDFPNRFAGTKSNTAAGQYIRNYFREAGLKPYYADGYYHRFTARYLKNSRYYMLNVKGDVENVVGRIPGKDPNKAVVITAHMDSFLGKGVVDNASGVAALLETAKRLSARFGPGEYPVDLVFVAYNAEECGLLGSRAFYGELTDRYSQCYNINMDCIGVKDKPLAVRNSYRESDALYAAFLPFLDKHQIPYRDIEYAADEDGEPMGTSDHEAFQENGRAAIILGEDAIRGIPNTRKDKDISMMDFQEMDRLVAAVEDFIVSTDGAMY